MNQDVRRRLLVFLGLLAAGIAGYVLLHVTAGAPARRPANEGGRPVRVMDVRPLPVVPTATGYGLANAQRSWQGIAEVGGTILEMSPDVEVGRTVRKGTVLFRIDPETVQLEKTRTEATVRGVRAQINELAARETSARASLELEQRVLDMAQKDLDRAKRAHAGGLAPLTDVETAERGVLNAQKSVQSLNNTLRELPAARRVLDAQLAQQVVGAEGARLGLAKAEAVAPFTMRISALNASVQQSVSAGQVVLVGDATDTLEVVAQFPVGTIGALMGRRDEPSRGTQADAGARAVDAGAPVPASARSAGTEETDAGSRRERRGRRWQRISATVRLKSQGVESEWEGTFRRFQGVDPESRTMGVVVTVEEPRRRQGRRGPPLLPGLHVEVELRGSQQDACLAIPRSALHGGSLYVVGPENRLDIRQVEIGLEQETYACIIEGLAPGDQVVLTDILPAVQGMLLAPRADTVASELLREASGIPGAASEKVPAAPTSTGASTGTSNGTGERTEPSAPGSARPPRERTGRPGSGGPNDRGKRP